MCHCRGVDNEIATLMHKITFLLFEVQVLHVKVLLGQ